MYIDLGPTKINLLFKMKCIHVNLRDDICYYTIHGNLHHQGSDFQKIKFIFDGNGTH